MSFQRWCLLFAVVVYFIAAWFGVGYYAEDEFQHVIAFAQGLRGLMSAESLPLEFHQQWRSMMQPVLCAGIFEMLGAIGITDPFTLTLVLRLATAALAIWVTHNFIRALLPQLAKEHERPFILASWFLWSLPVLQIRFTGEAWSGLLFLRGLTLLIDQRQRNHLVIGTWFGLAVLFRPAVALLPMGVVAWMLFAQKSSRRDVLLLIGGAVLMLLIGAVIDSMAYGQPVFSLWNYTKAGLLGEESWRFTSLPWYQYPLFIFKYATPLFGVLMLVAFCGLIVLRPKHVLVWIMAPFLIAHSLLPVKETRFLFPLAPLMPWLLISAWEAWNERSKVPAPLASKVVVALLIAVNGLALLVGIMTPAGNGKIELAEKIHQHFGGRAVHIDHVGDWRQWIPPFFLAPNSTSVFADEPGLPMNGSVHLVVAKRSKGFDDDPRLRPIACAFPQWTLPMLRWYHLEDGYDPLIVYEVVGAAR